MAYETLQLTISGRTAVIALNRPNAMNAMNFTMMRELAQCFNALHDETEVQVLVVEGAGKVFSAGGDVKMMAESNDFSDFNNIMDSVSALVKAFYTLPMITIAKVHGAAAGLGLSLALASDILVAEESSKIAMNFIGIGLVPDGGGHFFMKERLGTHKAKQQIWEGRVMNGEEAQALGLIDYCVSTGAAQATVDAIVAKVLKSPVASMIETKLLLNGENLPALSRVLDREAIAQTKMRQSKDHLEGITAFVEKREPSFIGK